VVYELRCNVPIQNKDQPFRQTPARSTRNDILVQEIIRNFQWKTKELLFPVKYLPTPEYPHYQGIHTRNIPICS